MDEEIRTDKVGKVDSSLLRPTASFVVTTQESSFDALLYLMHYFFTALHMDFVTCIYSGPSSFDDLSVPHILT